MVSPTQLSTMTILAIVAGAWTALPGSSARAEDGKTRLQPVPETQSLPPAGQQGQPGQQTYYGQPYGGAVVGQHGYCPSCQHGYGHGWGNGQRRMAPGTGWCAPGKVPVVRERVQYWQYYPSYWSGNGPGPATPFQPMVYTPTDTSQLGFYYQHVPTWTAQPWRIPGPPHPAYWHNRACGRCNQQHAGQFHHGYNTNVISYGQPVNSGATSTGPTPVAPQQAAPEAESSAPQSLMLPPQPNFRPQISLLPDAPPEV